jgi:electron transfer flavoprotein beta subunit
MGPPQAEVVLREAMARGADDVVLLTDRAFAGADTLATSYAISQAIKKVNARPDLVLFGKQAIDGDTAQVGPGVSEFLDCALVTYVKSIKVEGDTYTVETQMDEGVDVIEGKMPAVMTVVKEASTPALRHAQRLDAGQEGRDPALGCQRGEGGSRHVRGWTGRPPRWSRSSRRRSRPAGYAWTAARSLRRQLTRS